MAIQGNSPLYEVVGKKSPSKEANAVNAAMSTPTLNTEKYVNEPPQNIEVKNVIRCNKNTVRWLAISALTTVLVIVMACILPIFVNIADLRAETDSLQQQKNNNDSIQMTYQKLTEENTAAIALLNNSIESICTAIP